MFNQVVIPLVIQAIVFSITTAIVLIPPDHISGMTLFAVTILTCLVSGVLTAFLQGGTFGLAAQFPPKYSQAVMAGQGLGGAGVSLTKLATLLGSKASTTVATYASLRMGNFAYFFIASLFSLVSVAGYMMLNTLPFAKYYCKGIGRNQDDKIDKSEALLEENRGEDGEGGISSAKLWEIYATIKDKMLAVLLVFWVTLAVFPSVTVHIQSMSNYDDPNNSPPLEYVANPKSGNILIAIVLPRISLTDNAPPRCTSTPPQVDSSVTCGCLSCSLLSTAWISVGGYWLALST
jgi:equilibrative nucleoside transporter 1/2/3